MLGENRGIGSTERNGKPIKPYIQGNRTLLDRETLADGEDRGNLTSTSHDGVLTLKSGVPRLT